MKRPLLFTLFYYSEKIPPQKKTITQNFKLLLRPLKLSLCLGFEKKTVKHVEPFMVSWTPLPEYQAQKRRQNRNSSDQKKGSLSPAQPLHPKKTSECSTSFKGCEKVPGDLSRNLCELGINLYHLNLRQLYEKLKDEILFLGISSCLGFKKMAEGS